MNITLYKTPTCATCGIAGKRLVSAGANVEPIDLSEEPGVLAALKDKLGVPQSSMIQVPIFETEDGKLHDITDLPDLLKQASV